jgi:hypothetical protein
MGGNPNHHNQ